MADYFCAMFHCTVFQNVRMLHMFSKFNIFTRSVPTLASSPDHLNTSASMKSAKQGDKPLVPGQEESAVGSWVEGTAGEGPLLQQLSMQSSELFYGVAPLNLSEYLKHFTVK